MSFIKYTIFSFFLIAGLLSNIFWGHFAVLGVSFTAVFFVFFGLYLGQNFWPAEKFVSKLLWGILALISGAIVLLSITYYFYKIDNTVIAAFVIGAPILIGIITRLFPGKQPPAENAADATQRIVKPKIAFVFFLLNVFFLAVTAYIFVILAKARIDTGTVSPWQTAPPVFFLVFFIFILVGLILLGARWKENYNLPILALVTFVFLSVALIIYKFGYGFDSFIHRAAENYIGERGAIYPKSPYYIGQYVAIITIAKLLAVKIDIVDKLFLPVFASVYLPLAAYFSLSRLFNRKTAPLLALAILLIPPANLIVTTPYGLSLVFLLITVFLGINYLLHGRPLFLIVILMGLTTFFVHPISGIPALIFAFLVLILRRAEKHPALRVLGGTLGMIAAAAAVPAALTLLGKFSGGMPIIWQGQFNETLPALFRRFSFVLDFVYFYKTWLFIFIFVLAALGLVAARRQKRLIIPLSAALVAVGLFISYLAIKNFAIFPALAAAENQNYALRLKEIGFLFLLPAVFFALASIFENLSLARWRTRLMFFFLLAALFTASLYLTYPRRDIYENDHGWNVGRDHLKAVQKIEADAADKNYIVLADQAAAAAALDQFGFSDFKNGGKRHLQTADGEIFYYPIPLGGKLYEYFLRVIYAGGGTETILEAQNFARAGNAYFVVSDYWENYREIKSRFLREGAKIEEIDGKTIIVTIDN